MSNRMVVDSRIPSDLSVAFSNMALVCSVFVVITHSFHHVAGINIKELYSCLWWLDRICLFRGVAVPFFFLASGFFLSGHVLENGWWKHENLKRVKSLLVPYVLWNVLWTVYILFSGDRIVDWRLVFGVHILTHPIYMNSWYIRTLMVFCIMSPLVVLGIKRRPLAFLLSGLLLAMALALGDCRYSKIYFFQTFLGLGWIIWFMLGVFLRISNHPFAEWLRSVRIKGSAFIAICCACAVFWCVISFKSQLFGDGSKLMLVVRVVSPIHTAIWMYVVWRVCKLLYIPKWMASMSFPIFLIHPFVMRYACKVMAFNSRCLGVFCLLILSVAISMMATFIFRKCFPRVAAMFFGGR